MAIKFLNQLDLTVTSSLLKTDANGVIVAAVAGTDYLSTLPAHTHDDRYYTETESDARFLRKDADTTLTGTLFVDAVNGGSIAYSDPVGVYIPRPQGASYKTSTDAHTGAITVRLPGSIPADMLSFWVDVYDYAGNPEGESFSVYVYGYAYQTTTPWWTNVGALILSDRTDKSFTVRFGWDGTNHVVCIGETNSTWNYPQVVVRDFQAGYTADSSTFDDNWSIAFLTTLPSIGQTASNNYPVARSAFQLSTARSINGTNFDGTANITTANWGTARTITIGATGKSVNGSGNVSWTLGELQAEYQVPTNTIRNNLGDPTVREMALFHGQFNNKFRFIAPTLQEESTDGTTWVTSTRATAAQLGDMMIGEGQGTAFNAIPSAAVGTYGAYRLTWNVVGSTGYVFLNALYIYNSTNGNNVTVQIEAYHNTNGWVNITGPHTTSNWPGHAYIPHSAIYYSNSASQYSQVRITFTTTHNTNTNAFALYGIEWFGGYPQGRRNAEYYDRDKNVYFPAYVNGSRMVTSDVMASGTGGLAFKTSDGSDRMFLNNSGNFGIGTTSPSTRLEVLGDTEVITIRTSYPANLSQRGGLLWKDATNITGAIDTRYDGTTVDMYFGSLYNSGYNSTTRMVIKGNGNVGIGTTNPTEKLDVAGSGKIQGNLFLTAADPYIEGSGSGAMRIKHTAGQVMYIRPDQTGNVVFFEGASGQAVYLNTASPSVNSTQNSSSALTFEARARNAGGALNIKSTSLQNTVYDIANNLSRFSITGQDVLYLEGNVGIGTNSPSQKLHVAGNGRFEGNVGIGHGSAAEYFLEIGQGRTGNGFAYIDLIGDATYTDYGLRIIRNNSGANTPSSINHRGLGTFSLNAEDAAPIAFLTSSSERMRITSDGNVGIGTTSPQQALHIFGATNGYAMIQGASDSGQAGIYFKKEDTTGTMNRTKGLIVFHTNVGSGYGRGHLGFCLNSAESNTVVSVSDEKFRMVDNGDFLADGDVVAYSTTISDARYKTNIQPIESALDKVNQMRGVSFDWTAVRSGREFGVIAQEIEQIAPEVVSEKELLNGDTMKTVSYTSLVPFLIESIKELTQQVNELKAQLDGLTK